jgi:translation initiation factor 2B subunit (eIF-2B alpha/beta/delta family)
MKESKLSARQISGIMNLDKNNNQLSYRSNKNKDGASSRREPSSGRLIDQINTHPNEAVNGRPRTISEGNIVNAVGSSSGDLSRNAEE